MAGGSARGLTVGARASPQPREDVGTARSRAMRTDIQEGVMQGNIGFARIAGVVALGGAFYTATYITSYPGGAPAYAVLGLLAGTAAGIIACAVPRSATALTLAAVMLGFAFTGAVIYSGIGFLPGFV